MEMTELFNNFGSLFKTFQWWSVLLIAGVIAIMVPVNMLLKKICKKDEMARLRKVLAFVSVYIVSLAVVALFSWITSCAVITANYLFGASLALGFCSQFGWEIVKLIRDYGFKKFVIWISKKIDEDKAAKIIADKYSIDKQLVKTLISEAKAKINTNTDDIEKTFTEDTAVITDIHNRLANIVSAENLESAAKEVYELVNINK